MTVGSLPHLTAWTGADAPTHNVGSDLSNVYHPIGEGVALQGVRLCFEHLPDHAATPDRRSSFWRLLCEAPPVPDGALEDPRWQPGEAEADFTRLLAKGPLPTSGTRFRAIYDQTASSVGVECDRGGAGYWRGFVAPPNPHPGGRYRLRFWAVDYTANGYNFSFCPVASLLMGVVKRRPPAGWTGTRPAATGRLKMKVYDRWRHRWLRAAPVVYFCGAVARLPGRDGASGSGPGE